MQVSLVMFKSDGTRRDFPVSRDRLIVGRKNNCDLRIPLSSVSRQHCEIRVEGDSVKVRDLGSSNGTFHNSIRVQEAVLAPGDEVVVGPVVFTVVINGEPTTIKPVKSSMEDAALGAQAHADDTMSHGLHPGSQDREPVLTTHDDDDEDELPQIEPELRSQTVDLDDPIAALERMAEAERLGSSGNSASGSSLAFDFDLDDDEDDDVKEKKK